MVADNSSDLFPKLGAVHKLSLEQLLRVSYCGMMGYLQDDLGFPSWAPTIPMAWGRACKASILTYFNQELKGLVGGMNRAVSQIKLWDDIIQRKFPGDTLAHLRHRSESLLALSSIPKVYNEKADTVLGVNLPIQFNTEYCGEQFQITDTIDVLFYANDKVWGRRTARVLVVDDLMSPVFSSEKLSGVRLGLIYLFLRKQLEVPRHTLIEVAYLPTANVKWIPVTQAFVTQAELFLDETLKMWPYRSRLPVAEARKCKSCHYASVCDIDLLEAKDDQLKDVLGKIRETGRQMPFYEEQPWRLDENLTSNV